MSLELIQREGNSLVIESNDIIENYKDKPATVACNHDYVSFSGAKRVNNKDGENYYIPVRVTIPIRLFQKVILPYLNNHQYSQPEHLVYEDGKANYTYYNQVVVFWDNGIKKYAIIMKGETEPTIVTEEFYNKFVKDRI
jgi:hypothetical protein